MYTDFPPDLGVRSMADVQRVLGGFLEELYGPVQGPLRSLRLHGFVGVELRFAKQKEQTVARLYLVRRRLYLLSCTAAALDPGVCQRFLESFDLPWARRR